jgi:hypothetical protein
MVTKESRGEYVGWIERSLGFILRQLPSSEVEKWLRTRGNKTPEGKKRIEKNVDA